MLELSQKTELNRKLMLSQQMKRSLEILNMSIADLRQDIKRTLQENPLLDVRNTDEDSQYENADEIFLHDAGTAHSHIDGRGVRKSVAGNDTGDPFWTAATKPTLKDMLFEQLGWIKINSQMVSLCRYIIENIDDRGYLDYSLQDISRDLHVPLALAERALAIIQGFTPAGIAARCLKECLAIQALQRSDCDEKLLHIIDGYLGLIADNKIKELAKAIGTDVKSTVRYCEIIKSLEPRPSRGYYTGTQMPYIIPDAYVWREGDNLHVQINESALPRLVISESCLLAEDAAVEEQTMQYIRRYRSGADAYIKALSMRNGTIYSVLCNIIERQKDYFLHGEKSISPMKLSDIAEQLGLSESTVSRAVSNKYIQTEYRTLEVKSLFSRAVGAEEEENGVSALMIKQYIKDIVMEEDKFHPLSDAEISARLSFMNITISRRTVAKYRDETGIPSSSKRRQYR